MMKRTKVFLSECGCKSAASSLQTMEAAKKAAAYAAVDECLTEMTTVIGIGSGSTVAYCVERIAQRINDWNDWSAPCDLVCIPTSYQSRDLVIQHGLTLGDLQQYPEIQVHFDGADEIDEHLDCIKGAGGCFLQEKIVAGCSKTVVMVVDESKLVSKIGQKPGGKIPIEVIPMAQEIVKRKLLDKYDAKIRQFPFGEAAFGKVGPVITDNGNIIFDITTVNEHDVQEISNMIGTHGIVSTGVFLGVVDKVYIGAADGTVHRRARTDTLPVQIQVKTECK